MADKKVKLSFKDKEDSTKLLTIDIPKGDLVGDDIKTAMDKIIESNVIATKNGPITSKNTAYEEVVQKKEYEIF